MHPRQLIRNAIANILLGNPQSDLDNPVYPISEVGVNVFPNRPVPMWETELPSICIYTKSETVQPRDGENLPKHYDRTLEVIVEILVQAETGFDDKVDDIAEKVENLLLYQWQLKDPILGVETCDNLVMRRTDIVFVGENVKNVIAAAQIIFEISYNKDVVFPSLLDDFDSMQVEYNIDNARGDGHEGAEAVDIVTNIYTP